MEVPLSKKKPPSKPRTHWGRTASNRPDSWNLTRTSCASCTRRRLPANVQRVHGAFGKRRLARRLTSKGTCTPA